MNNYILSNERLKVKISLPGIEYRGSRFDWMGMITDVVLDNKDKFCSKESLIEGEGTDGKGLYNEFGIEDPIGYEDAAIGDEFPKIGVGLLKKESSKAYDFFHQYSINEFKNEVKVEDDNITFICNPKETRGYEIKYIKKISIKENELIVDYTIENLGKKAINTTEYCHNFILINDKLVGNDYLLRFSYPVEMDNKPEILDINNNEIMFNQEVKDVFYCRLKNFSKERGQYFELIHKASGVGVRESSDFNIERVAIWGMEHVISPEVFVNVNINPGESQSWKRTYKFFN